MGAQRECIHVRDCVGTQSFRRLRVDAIRLKGRSRFERRAHIPPAP